MPLPSTIVTVDPETLAASFSTYDSQRHTGHIDCVLTAEAPLYVRGGLTVDEVRQRLQAKDLPGFFAADRDPAVQSPPQPVIPGSSLRGMLRALVEIAAYAKVSRVTERQHYYFRAVAAKVDDPLALPYRTQLRDVRTGYLEHTSAGWAIRPAQPFGKEGYLKARERDVPDSLGLIRLNDRRYRPQYIPVSFTTKTTKTGRLVVDRIDQSGIHQYSGTMVTSGNMLETSSFKAEDQTVEPHKNQEYLQALTKVKYRNSELSRARSQLSPRKNHAVVGEPDPKAQLLQIDPQAIEDYKASLTDFQRGDGLGADGPFHPLEGIFAHRDGRPAEGRPIFYCEPARGQPVVFFGQSPNFRVPYRFPGSQRAASPLDFVPEELRSDDVVDIAEAIFGFVRDERQRESKPRAGRVFVSDAVAEEYAWLADEPIVPRILGSPKPTTFQHYLVQTSAEKRQLRHYGSRPGDETVIRGHKLYWHKGNPARAEIEDTDFLQEPADRREQDTQHTSIRPVAAGSRFLFRVRFTNLSDVELGALLWVLRLSDDSRWGDRQYRLKIGMGKPLGLGAVRLDHEIILSERARRYGSLFSPAGGWELAESPMEAERADACVAAFEEYVLTRIAEGERPPAGGRLSDVLRIQMLLAMLSWPGPMPVTEYSRYMEIERREQPRVGRDPNEYKDRPVLPGPLQVLAMAEGRPLPEEPVAESEPVRTPITPPPPPRPAPKAPEIPPVGHVFPGKILGVDETAMLIEIEGFTQDRALGVVEGEGLHKRFKVGNSARVEVTGTRTQKNGRVIVQLKLARRA